MSQKANNLSSLQLVRLGAELRDARIGMGLSQSALAARAGIGRSTVVHVESGRGVTLANTLKLAGVLGASLGIRVEDGKAARRAARADAQAKALSWKNAHLALAIRLMSEPRGGRVILQRARETVDRWEAHQTCSPAYIQAWRGLLAGTPRRVGQSLGSLAGPWANALLQNTPFAGTLVEPAITAA